MRPVTKVHAMQRRTCTRPRALQGAPPAADRRKRRPHRRPHALYIARHCGSCVCVCVCEREREREREREKERERESTCTSGDTCVEHDSSRTPHPHAVSSRLGVEHLDQHCPGARSSTHSSPPRSSSSSRSGLRSLHMGQEQCVARHCGSCVCVW
jgi:hypothetical protein